jgi:FtsZ-interacting cell division protein ZipA
LKEPRKILYVLIGIALAIVILGISWTERQDKSTSFEHFEHKKSRALDPA